MSCKKPKYDPEWAKHAADDLAERLYQLDLCESELAECDKEEYESLVKLAEAIAYSLCMPGVDMENKAGRLIAALDVAIKSVSDEGVIEALEDVKRCLQYGENRFVKATDVIMNTDDNLMLCPHCGESLGNTADWTPNFCHECGKPLTGGNGKCK